MDADERFADDRPLRRVNLNDLYALDAILHAPTLTAAGRMVSLSQPAMSMALRKLRIQFADRLVSYAGGQRQLTPLAEALRGRTRRLLREADDAFHLTMQFDPATTERTVTIAAPESVQLLLLSHVVPSLLQQAPGLKVDLMPFDHGGTERMFERGADMALVPGQFASRALASRPLFDQGVVAMVWNRHPLAAVGSLDREQFLGGRHAALFERIERNEFGAILDESIFSARRIVVRTGLHSALPRLAVGTDLIVTAASWLAQFHAAMWPLQLLKLPGEFTLPPVVAQWQEHRGTDPMIRWLMARILDVLARKGPTDNRWHQSR
ncbi:MAG: LysR family transcriptional regulator [Sphingomonas adhaesiva]|uniref:LysR family transcriptional regulator n=1 Tax=Sphingomonas adhaesiva TaxID=28212 RepID=UPI002FF5254F